MVVFRDMAITLPKFDVVPANELPGVFFRGVVVRADQFDCPNKATVRTDDIGSIFCHLPVYNIAQFWRWSVHL
jgi:hypothetical protein